MNDEWTPSTMQGPKTNIYLKTWPNRTTMQVFNILRSKLTYEAKLLKSRGATQSWHERARPFHDGTVDIQRLAEFAHEHLGLPIGDPEYENSGGGYPDDPLPTHNGLTKSSADAFSMPLLPLLDLNLVLLFFLIGTHGGFLVRILVLVGAPRGRTGPFFRPGRGGHLGGPATKWGGRAPRV
jgi:hypothetical protein